jgi:hypothetical protein
MNVAAGMKDIESKACIAIACLNQGGCLLQMRGTYDLS